MAVTQKEPEEYARAVLNHFGLKRIENIGKFAGKIGLEIREVDSRGFEGALIRVPNKPKGIIAVKKDIRELGRKVFTAAHEIGHYFLPGHGVRDCYCKSSEIESWQKNVIREQEIAANRFASEILLPAREIYEFVKKRKATIESATDLCAEFQTSLTATALKCVDVSEEKCALIWSVDGTVKWFKKNENFRLFIRRGNLDEDSKASQIMRQSFQNHIEGEVNPEVWLEGESGIHETRIWEDSISLPSYNSVLSILTVI